MIKYQQTEVLQKPPDAGFVYGISPAIRTLNNMVAAIARTNIPVLLFGETGTGKDAYARLIYRLSLRQETTLHKLDCTSFDPDRIARELRKLREGNSSSSSLDTVYLDNVQDLDMASQRALLSHLNECEDADYGMEHSLRLISSAASSLEAEVDSGRFRRELYFRLGGVCLRIPTLQERLEDIPAMVDQFLYKYSTLLKKDVPHLIDRYIQVLSAYHWPGNIRELENFARRAVLFSDIQMALSELQTTHARAEMLDASSHAPSLKLASRVASKRAERELILQALERTRWNRKRAARDLQISYKSLLYKIKQIGVSNGKTGEMRKDS